MLLRVGETRALHPVPDPDPTTSLGVIENLFASFITDVKVDAVGGAFYRVDTFEFLYDVLARVYCLHKNECFVIGTGEGLSIVADPKGDHYNLAVCCDSYDSYECSMSIGEMLLFLSSIATDVVKSIETAGFDTGAYIRKYQPGLF